MSKNNQGLNLDADGINWKFRTAFSITRARLIRLKTKSWILAPWTWHNFGIWDHCRRLASILIGTCPDFDLSTTRQWSIKHPVGLRLSVIFDLDILPFGRSTALEFHAVHINCYIEINWHCTEFSRINIIYVSLHAWFISFHISSKHVLSCFLSASKVFRCRRSHGQRLRRKRKKWRNLRRLGLVDGNPKEDFTLASK